MLHQRFNGDFGIGNLRNHTINDFAQIVRRNVGCHANGDSACAVYQNVWKTRGQHAGFGFGAIIIRLKIDCFLINILKQRHRRFCQARLSVTHGGWRIAVDGTKVALTINQRQTHGKNLRHAHQRIVN